MKLLKIGTLNTRNRWLDSLEIFEKLYVFCSKDEIEIEHPNIVYIKFQ